MRPARPGADERFLPQIRAERLIAAGRVVLAASSLLAVWLDPSEPVKYANVAYLLLVAYVVYALMVMALSWGPSPPSALRRGSTHVFDLVFFSLFIYFTAGPASPFIAYFVFSLVSATLRWKWKGTLWTAVTALSIFLGLGYYFAEVLEDPTFQLHSFIIRAVYLAVVAALLGYLGRHEQESTRVMTQLADWAHRVSAADEPSLDRDLRRASEILRCPLVALAWNEGEEPWLHLAVLDGTSSIRRIPPVHEGGLVVTDLSGRTFFRTEGAGPAPTVWYKSDEGLKRWLGEPIGPALADRLPDGLVISCPLEGDSVEGRAFFAGRSEATLDDLTLAEVVTGVLTARIERQLFLRLVHDAAVNDERVRVARDLHDGVLQSLTGVALTLAATGRWIEEDRERAVASLQSARERIAAEQRDLRLFIDGLRPDVPAASDSVGYLGSELAQLAGRVGREWGLSVELDSTALVAPVPYSLAGQVQLLVREALANAVRHGAASRARIEIADAGPHLLLVVADDGRGLPTSGTYGDVQLRELGIGPRNIRERVAALHGTLELVSSAAGVRLSMQLPLRQDDNRTAISTYPASAP